LNESSLTTTHPKPLLAALILCWREILRFFRQRNRIIGAIATPLVFWLLFGAGLDRSFELSAAGSDGQGFREYFFPGTLAMILLFTAIFASISIIEDRREGFLQSVLVAPIPRWSMVLGKILGGTLIALIQGSLFCLLALTLPNATFDPLSLLGLLGIMFVVSLALTALGYLIAWRMDSTQGFHAIMNLVLMPMWLLSGSFFPIPSLESSRGIMYWIMTLNPLTYGVTGIRWLMFENMNTESTNPDFFLPSLQICWIVSLAFALVTFVMAWKVSGSRTTADLL
jgi:ABC-2 type transport system permease protein